jgi:hypothetical protein
MKNTAVLLVAIVCTSANAGASDGYALANCAGTFTALSGLHANGGNAEEAKGYALLAVAFLKAAEQNIPKSTVGNIAYSRTMLYKRWWEENNDSGPKIIEGHMADCTSLGRSKNVGRFMK